MKTKSAAAADLAADALEALTEFAIVATDLQGGIVLWNAGARKLYGYAPDQVVGAASVDLLYPPEDVARGMPRAVMAGAIADGKWEGRLEGMRMGGGTLPVYVVATPRRDDADRPTGFVFVSKDISGEISVADELRAAQVYARALNDSNVDALATTDPLGLITDVNPQMCQMTGRSRDELIGSAFKDSFTEPGRVDEGIRRVLAEDRVTNYELTLRARDGHETLVSFNATTFRDAGGRLRGVFAAARDISDQKQLEEDLRQVQTYTRGLIEASKDGLFTVDPQLRVSDVNEQMSRMTGYSREELIGTPFSDYFTDPVAAASGVEQTLDEGFVTNYVLVLRSKTGTERGVSFNASVFKGTEGEVRGIFASARDITEQLSLEEELRQQQNYTRGLIESSVDAMLTVDADMTITGVNEQMVRLTEVARDSLIGSRFASYFTEPERATAGVRQTLREGSATNYELTLRTPSGREVLVSFNASVYKDTGGRVRGIYAIARDVTEQRRLEELLREQQNYSRSLIESLVDALVTIGPSGLITDVNEQMVRLTGRRREQLVGQPFAELVTEPDRATAAVHQTFAEGTVKNHELAVRAKSGAATLVSLNAAVFRDTTGEVAGVFAAARDITDQTRLEGEIREQQAYSRGLVDSNIDALMTTDTLGVITDVNPQMFALTAYTRDELIGSAFKDYFTDPKRAEDGVRRVLSDGRVTNYELTMRAKDGRETMVSYNATTFAGSDGKLRGVFASARDITDQKRLEEELRQQQNYNRGLIESSVDAMLTVDPDMTMTDVNEQMVRLTGYAREQLLGSSFQDYFTEPDRAVAGVRQTLADGFVTNYQLTLRSRQRREILVSFNASVYKDTAGRVRGIYATARDVTEQRRLEEQLHESRHYVRGLIESSVDAQMTIDPDVTITDVNDQMARLTGYTRDELIGSPFRDYFTEPTRAAEGVRQALAEGSVANYELTLRSKSGRRTVASFNAGTFTDVEGRVAGILATARDITAQKRLAEELRHQQTYYRGLIESSADALLTVSPDGTIADVNQLAVDLSGHSRRHLIGSRFDAYFTDRARAAAGVKQTFDQEVVANYELVVRTRSGRKLPVSFNAAVFRDADGQVAGILAAARDISQQKQVEVELREQQTYTRGLIESNIDALMTTDTLGVITDVNRQMIAVTGWERDELIGTPFKDYFTDPKRAEDAVRQVLSDGRVTNYELMIRARDGVETLVSYNATTFTGADGRLRGVFAAARDITDQKRLEEQIRQQNRELTETTTFMNSVMESATESSIIAMDRDGLILAWNEGARRNYGYSADEIVGKANARILNAPELTTSDTIQELFATADRTGKAEGVVERVRKSGERFPASVAKTLRRDAEGNPIGYVLISKDITEQKRLEAQIQRTNEELEQQARRVQEANRMKSEFLANMSHELRTPLNGIIGFSELMYDGRVGALAPQHQEYVALILQSARHLLQLVNDVLDLAKVESGKFEFVPEPVDLPKLLGEVTGVQQSVAAQKRVRVEVDVAAEIGQVVVDPAKLKQVVYNYLSNAIKFSPDAGRVLIRAVAEGPDLFRIEIEDAGIGIKPEDLERLFVEFQQLDASAAKKHQGTGLGLVLTKRIVEAQGGHVGVRSVVGKGSTFFAVLPRMTHPAQTSRRRKHSNGR
jgi:PAS domain S-box-containing protein